MNAHRPVTEQLPKVLQDITRERAHQIELGYTTEHDDTHSTEELVDLAFARLDVGDVLDSGARPRILEAAAILVAAVEAIDREVTT